MLQWRFTSFDELTVREVHDVYQARVGVFVVEQDCVFQDVDGADPACWHLLGREGETLVAYCRLVPPGLKYSEPSIGRVLTSKAARRSGAGRALMAEALDCAERLWPGQAIRIGAQHYLEHFYGTFGFVQASDPYDEDGIQHIEMVRNAER